MDLADIEHELDRFDKATTPEELRDAFEKIIAWETALSDALDAMNLEDGIATSYPEVKKPIWLKKLLKHASARQDRKEEVELKFDVPNLGEFVAPKKGKLLLPHNHRGKVKQGTLIDLYGLPSYLLDVVIEKVNVVVTKLKRNTENLNHTVLMTLFWMRKNAPMVDLQRQFGVSSEGRAYTLIRRGLIYLRVALDSLVPKSTKWSNKSPLKKLVNYYGEVVSAVGNLDGTAMYRRIKHGNSWLLFRGDRDRAALTTQILSDFNGRVLDAVVCYGHNADGGILSFSGTKKKLEELGLAVLVDSGYEADRNFVTPESGAKKSRMTSKYNEAHGNVRSGVEQVNSWIKNWKVVTACRVSIKLQSTAIIVACCLYNLWRKQFPLERTTWVDGTDLSMLTARGPKVVRGLDREENLELEATLKEVNDLYAKVHSQTKDDGGGNEASKF